MQNSLKPFKAFSYNLKQKTVLKCKLTWIMLVYTDIASFLGGFCVLAIGDVNVVKEKDPWRHQTKLIWHRRVPKKIPLHVGMFTTPEFGHKSGYIKPVTLLLQHGFNLANCGFGSGDWILLNMTMSFLLCSCFEILSITVEPPFATTSRKLPPLISGHFSKIQKFFKSNYYRRNLS